MGRGADWEERQEEGGALHRPPLLTPHIVPVAPPASSPAPSDATHHLGLPAMQATGERQTLAEEEARNGDCDQDCADRE